MKRYELAENILRKCKQEQVEVTIFMANGFQMRGHVLMSDQYSLVLTGDSKIAKVISYNQISTIDFPARLFSEMSKENMPTQTVSSTEPFSIIRAMFRECWETNQKVHVYMGNGFQMEGRVANDDAFSFVLLPENENKVVRLIFFAQLSTIDFALSTLKNIDNHRNFTPTQEKNQ